MAFIANGKGVTLGGGTYNNIQGNLNIFHGSKRQRDGVGSADAVDALDWGEPVRKRMREEEEDGLEVREDLQRMVKHLNRKEQVIRDRDLNLIQEMGSGPGYLFHAGRYKDRAVIVKVFNAGARAREHLDATVALSKGLLHPNVLRIRGTSSPTSPSQFIAYEDAYWKNAEGPLAEALRDGTDRSVVLGFKLVAGLSSGINYLDAQDLSRALRAVDFDVFLDVNERFLLSFNSPSNAPEPTQRDGSAWALFNALCQKVFRLANRELYEDDIERTPVVFDPSSLPPSVTSSPTTPLEHSFETPEEQVTMDEDVPPVPPRREYVWRTMDTQQSLATIAAQIHRDLDVRRTPIHKLAWTNKRSAHRCPGYVREEVTLATRLADSVVVLHDSPDPREVCPICHEVVVDLSAADPDSQPIFECTSCGTPSHGYPLTATGMQVCRVCGKNPLISPPRFIELPAEENSVEEYYHYAAEEGDGEYWDYEAEERKMEVDKPSPKPSLVGPQDPDWAWSAPVPHNSPFSPPRSFSYPPPGHPMTNSSPYVPASPYYPPQTYTAASYLIHSPHWSPDFGGRSLDPTPEVRYAVLPSFSPPSLPHASL